MNDKLKIFSGRSNIALGKDIANYLGKDLGQLTIKTFSDGELWLQFEENTMMFPDTLIHRRSPLPFTNRNNRFTVHLFLQMFG